MFFSAMGLLGRWKGKRGIWWRKDPTSVGIIAGSFNVPNNMYG